MDPRPSPLLTSSALLFLVAALALLFAPDEILARAGASPSVAAATLLQLLAAALFGFFLLNWNSRRSRIGGIYGRPLLLANLAHATVAALTLGHLALRTPPGPLLGSVLALYALLAVAFGTRLFRGPADPGHGPGR
jgi:hypothetical protein